MRRLLLLAFLIAATSVLVTAQRGAGGGPLRFCPGSGIPCVEITREAYDRGHQQFQQSCGFCHGPTAAGGNGGPNLIYSPVIRLDKGDDVIRLIQQGRPEKGMPVVPLTPAQTSDIVAYLKARIAEVDKTSGLTPSRDYDLNKLLTGDAERGKAFFNGAGQCATCHSPTGDLKGVAAKYPSVQLQARFLYPAGARRRATVTDAAGKQFSGDIVQQDAFDVTIRMADGTQRSWPASSVKVDAPDPLAKHLELLPKYANSDMHDVFAYLVTLK